MPLGTKAHNRSLNTESLTRRCFWISDPSNLEVTLMNNNENYLKGFSVRVNSHFILSKCGDCLSYAYTNKHSKIIKLYSSRMSFFSQ